MDSVAGSNRSRISAVTPGAAIRGVRLAGGAGVPAPSRLAGRGAAAPSAPEHMRARAPRNTRGGVGSGAPHASPVARLRALVAGLAGRGKVVALLVVAVLVVVVSLYGPTRDWYVALRHGQELEMRYAELTTENESLESELQHLQTREGIEDEAHRRGYVNRGETSVVVENLPDEMVVESTVAPVVMSSPQTDTRSLGTRLLDFIFGYQTQVV